MKQKIFKEFFRVYFWVGVNIIGIPIIHTHSGNVYKIISKK